MTNPDYVGLLQECLHELEKWTKDGKCNPKTEADVQCFLYHCLLEKLGSAKDIHAELRIKRKRIDLFIGDRALVEIKYILRSGNREEPDWRSRFEDAEKAIDRLRECMKDRIGVLVIYAESYNREKDEEWYDAVKESCEKSGIIMLRGWKP